MQLGLGYRHSILCTA